MRFKDFGFSSVTALRDIYFPVSIQTTSIEDSETIKELEDKNKEHLRPWKLETVKTESNEGHFYSVLYRQCIVGQIILWGFDREDGNPSCMVSYWIDKDHCNNGIVTSALKLITKHAFEDLGVKEIKAMVQTTNGPSIKVLQKLGFVKNDFELIVLTKEERQENHDFYSLFRV